MGGSENAVKTCMNLRNQQLKVITDIYRENDVHKSHGNHKPKIQTHIPKKKSKHDPKVSHITREKSKRRKEQKQPENNPKASNEMTVSTLSKNCFNTNGLYAPV